MRLSVKHIITLSVFQALLCSAFAQSVPESNYLRGKANLESGQYDSALVYLDKALTIKPGDANVLFSKGMALYRKSQYAMAVKEFEQVEKVSKGRASIWIARSYANLGDADHCIAALDVHLESNFRLPESTLLLDPNLVKLENDPKYIAFWKNGSWYTGLDQTLAEAGYLTRSGKYPEAINVISEGIEKGYRKAPLYAKRAEVYLDAGNYKLALDDLNQSIEMDLRNPELLVLRANIYYVTGKFKPALDDYTAALKLNPQEIKYYVGRAMAMNKSGLYEDAKADMKLYLDFYPENDSAWYHFGQIHYDNGNYFEAIDCFNKSLKISQHDARYFAARGATYLKTKTYQYAWKDLSMALDLDPRNPQILINKGFAALNTGKKDDACYCFEMAKKMGDKEGFNLVEKYCK